MAHTVYIDYNRSTFTQNISASNISSIEKNSSNSIQTMDFPLHTKRKLNIHGMWRRHPHIFSFDKLTFCTPRLAHVSVQVDKKF